MADHLDELFEYFGGVAGKQIIDIGSGAGWLVRRLSEGGAECFGVEVSPTLLEQAVAADAANADRYLHGEGQDLPFDDDRFDAAVFSMSLHHVPSTDLGVALGEAMRVVRSGGHVHIVEPVAAGLGHEVDALVDDETTVRALAQQAVNEAASDSFTEVLTREVSMGSSYADVASYENILVGIDPDRATAFAERADEVRAAFHANAQPHDDAWWFEDQMLIRSFHVG